MLSSRRQMKKTSSLRVIAVLLVAAGLSIPSPPALAADTAQKAYEEGKKLHDQGRHEAALERFRAAHAATGSPNARIMIADTLQLLGRFAEAYDEFATTRAEAAAKAETDRRYEQTRDDAARELSKLEVKVGKVVVALAQPEGARVTLNGVSLPPERVGVPIAVMPGKVEVVVEGPDGPPMRREADIPAGQTKTIFVAPTTGAQPPPAVIEPPPEPVKTGGGVRIAGFVVAGLGVVGLGVFGVTTAMSQSKYETMVEQCGGERCTDPRFQGVVDEGKRLDTIAMGSLIGGAACVAAGAVMIAVGGPKEAKRPTARVEVGPGGAMVRLGGVF